MAATGQAHPDRVTAPADVPAVFARALAVRPAGGLGDVADAMLAAAAERFSTVLIAVPVTEAGRGLFYLGDPPVRLDDRTLRWFRPLLALFSGIGTRETGRDVNPYGDTFELVRPSSAGPVRLYVDFRNTPADQRIQIVREAIRPSAPEANGTADRPPAP